MDEVIRLHDQYYILATSSRAHDRTRVIKQGDTFAIFDHFGDVVPFGLGEQGLYHRGTRHLSRLDLRLNGVRPLLLSSSVREDNDLFVVDLTNPDIPLDADAVFPRDILHIHRSKFLWEAACFERLHVTNHGLDPARLSLEIRFGADFVDIFEVRGTTRPRRGRMLEPRYDDGALVLAYEGLDGVMRRTHIECSPAPDRMEDGALTFSISLPRQGAMTLTCTIRCEASDGRVHVYPYERALQDSRTALLDGRTRRARVETANEQFNEWIGRSIADLEMMLTRTPHGTYPYAGVPWFSTPFGRDGIITALEMLWIDPDVARGVLSYLAATQATAIDREQDAEPGKILHETRSGEMAALGEIPFGRYYGSVDATPLFVVLAGAYYERTADRDFIARIWPNVEAALRWIDVYGDRDGDGLVEYIRHTPEGLALDGRKQPCQVRASNAGHCLFGRIAGAERAARIGALLTSEELFSGWGVRTLATREVRYNPMSYHNGSVWPHDNALIASGLAAYGLTDAAMALFAGMFDLSQFVDQHRLPELVCGFVRRPGEGPTLYPVACAPQSWAAGALFLLLQGSLGLFIRAPERQIVFDRALLPEFLPWVRISNLQVGDATVDLLLERHPYDVGIQVLRRSGDVRIVAVK